MMVLNFPADATATDWNAVAVDYNHYPTTQYANSGPYGTSIGATYEYSGGVNDHRPESPGDDKVQSKIQFYTPFLFMITSCIIHYEIYVFIFPILFFCSFSAASTT